MILIELNELRKENAALKEILALKTKMETQFEDDLATLDDSVTLTRNKRTSTGHLITGIQIGRLPSRGERCLH